MRKMYSFLLFAILCSCWSCVSQQELAYFQSQEEKAKQIQEIENNIQLIIQSGDELAITVSGLTPEVALAFNTASQTQSREQLIGYQVDNEGNIYFPVIGKVKAAGLSLSVLNEFLTAAIKEHINEPVVNIRFANLRVTVLGEVNRPGVIQTNSDQLSILEAIGLAGDLTDFGNRENILLVREQAGQRERVYLNLLSAEIFTSPYYYLRQNDIIYVEPAKRKTTALNSQQTSQILSIITSVASFVALVIAVAK